MVRQVVLPPSPTLASPARDPPRTYLDVSDQNTSSEGPWRGWRGWGRGVPPPASPLAVLDWDLGNHCFLGKSSLSRENAPKYPKSAKKTRFFEGAGCPAPTGRRPGPRGAMANRRNICLLAIGPPRSDLAALSTEKFSPFENRGGPTIAYYSRSGPSRV